jgi:phosphoglycolate phosphatase-like HAD superfamily hydrolase
MTQQAILFDLDGTLVDSVPDLAAAVNALLAELGRRALDLAQVTRMVGDGTSALVERALAASGAAGTPLRQAHDRFLALYEADPTRLTRPYPGVADVLGRLAAAGSRLGVCTNKPERATRAVLAGLDLERFFGHVGGLRALRLRRGDAGGSQSRRRHRSLCRAAASAQPHLATRVGATCTVIGPQSLWNSIRAGSGGMPARWGGMIHTVPCSVLGGLLWSDVNPASFTMSSVQRRNSVDLPCAGRSGPSSARTRS